MTHQPTPDLNCVPYNKKGLYFTLTIPILLIMIAIFTYLWQFSFLLSLAYLFFYLLMSFFQAYPCAYQDCPYIGKFCPAILGIYPGNLFAKLLYSGKNFPRSPKKFKQHATIAVIGWAGLILLPLYWLGSSSILFAAAYVIAHAIYAVIFVTQICPACAIRATCPGGRMGQQLLNRKK